MNKGNSGQLLWEAENGGIAIRLRLSWAETFDPVGNHSVLTVTGLEAASGAAGGWYPTGEITLEGAALVTMDGTKATHRLDTGGADTWRPIRSWQGGAVPPWVSAPIVHDAGGKKTVVLTVKLSLWRDSQSIVNFDAQENLVLTHIPRASGVNVDKPTVAMGETLGITVTPAMPEATHVLEAVFRERIYPIAAGVTTAARWQIPLELAGQIPDSPSEPAEILCRTFLEGKEIGQSRAQVTLTVPRNGDTLPAVSVTVTPVSELGDAFSGLFIQGKTRVRAEIQASSRYSKVESVSAAFEGTVLSGERVEFPCPAAAGQGKLTVTVTDSRGFETSHTTTVPVMAYQAPEFLPWDGETEIRCFRCLDDGTEHHAGSRVRLRLARRFSPVMDGDVQKNYCGLTCLANGVRQTLLSQDDPRTQVDVVLEGSFSPARSHGLVLRMEDTLGSVVEKTFRIPTEMVTFQLKQGGDGAAFGKVAQRSGTLDMGFAIHMNDHPITGLPQPENPADAVPWSVVQSILQRLERLESAAPMA